MTAAESVNRSRKIKLFFSHPTLKINRDGQNNKKTPPLNGLFFITDLVYRLPRSRKNKKQKKQHHFAIKATLYIPFYAQNAATATNKTKQQPNSRKQRLSSNPHTRR
ncbi:hypothetical protein [Photobacterium satsumensis]|uniref:hypothetical protein n=1 Tax=Photobacterium satsumensis TaxID=2910239 RepID=UPI003D142CC0